MLNNARLLAAIGFFTAFGAPVSAMADQPGASWPILLQSLKSKGVRRVGDLDLDKLHSAGRGVNWVYNPSAPPSEISGSRESAYNLCSNKTVYISPNSARADRGSLPQLELHEVFGALCYDDSDTQLSTALQAIDQTEDPAERSRLVQVYGRSLFKRNNLMLARIGGSSVGGGGDLSVVAVKQAVLEYVRRAEAGNPQLVSSEFFRQYPSVKFEPVRQKGVASSSLTYRYMKGKKRNSETLGVLVPMGRWAADRDSLTAEIAKKLMSIYPTGSGQASRTFTPSGCPASKQITYPYTDDSTVAEIQERRAAILLGCDPYADVFGYQGSELIAGGVPRGAEPKNPGQYNFSCSYNYGGQNYPSEERVPAGKNVQHSTQFGISQGDFISGTLQVKPNGNIGYVAIVYKSPEGVWVRPTIRSPQSPTSGSYSLEINGSTLTFSCERI